MRRMVMVAVALGLGIGAYATLRHGEKSRPPTDQQTAPDHRSVRPDLSSILRADRGVSAPDHEDLERKIDELERRLAQIEPPEADGEPTDEAQPAHGRSLEMAEADLASWLDESLRVGARDEAWGHRVRSELEAALPQVPGTRAEDVACGKRFCRLKLARDDGKMPQVLRLLGSPPFENETFTVNGADGTVTMYLTRMGQSVTGLREEALAAAEQP